MSSKITDPKGQLEALEVYQETMESYLHKLTGLTVKISFSVHTSDNSTADLLQLFEAGISLPNFEQRSASTRTWIAYKDLSKNISIFMPKGFDEHPEPEDDEGYNQAVENANARQTQRKPRIVEWAESDNEEPFDPSSTKRPF